MPRQHGYTGPLTSSALVFTGRCRLHGILIAPDGTNPVAFSLFDNTVGSGSTPVPASSVPADTLPWGGMVGLDIPCDNGLYLTMSGGSPKAHVYFTAIK